jgi:two-component system chemotaxis sensor kinase CheA
MDKFKKKFLEEAIDNLAELEEALLQLEHAPNDSGLIERVFRYMHSIKGGGAMFGFKWLSDFTHHLENIYDRVREGTLSVNQGLLDVTFQSVDHMKNLLQEDDQVSADTEIKHKNLTVQMMQLLEAPEKKAPEKASGNQQDKDDRPKTFYISFDPAGDIFDNGTNPMFLMDELAGLGDLYPMPFMERVPLLEEMDPRQCYTHWEVVLSTKEEEQAIHDVFIFVEDLAQIDIRLLADSNLLDNEAFRKELDDKWRQNEGLGLDALKALAASCVKSENPTGKGEESKRAGDQVRRDDVLSSIRVGSEKIDHMMNLVSELVTTQARLSLHAEQSEDNELAAIAENVQKLTRQLRDNAFDIALVPVETMLTRFHRLVRDLSNNLNKQVRLVTEGAETELDKNIIEKLTDPLLHILRNSIDHGIETPEEREKAGKPKEGKITLKAYYSGASVHIQVHDDGKGVDAEKIKNKAVQRQIIASDSNLSRKEILDLIFLPGFSTSTNVTDVSGRGVGMDVVKRNLADIRGEVEVDSEPGSGTTLTVKLPLTLSIIDGLLVQLSDNQYVIPLSAVDKIYAARHSDVVDTFNNLIVLDGERIPFFYLREEFGLPESDSETEEIVVVQYDNNRIGLVVDNVIGEYQAVLKSLGKMYKYQDMISGATILGDGTVALVMDTNKMIDRFSEEQQKKIYVESPK